MLSALGVGEYAEHVNSALIGLLDSIPEDKMDWCPQPELWNFRGILMHIPMARHHWLAGIIGDGEAIPDVVRECQTKSGMKEQLILSSARLQRFISNAALLDAEYAGEWDGKPWRHSGHWIAFQLLEHDIHHRATIFDYLALLGLPHPSFETLTFSNSDAASKSALVGSHSRT
jgi:uncharacterized damage-inducible protein DinB